MIRRSALLSFPFRRALAPIIGVAALAAVPLALLASNAAPAPVGAAPGPDASQPVAVLAQMAARAPEDKVAADLAQEIEAGGKAAAKAEHLVIVRSAGRLEFPRWAEVKHRITWPAGEQLALVQVAGKDVGKLAGVPGVARVESGDPMIDRAPDFAVDPDASPEYSPLSAAELRPLLDNAPTWAETQAAIARNDSDGDGVADTLGRSVGSEGAVDAPAPGAQPDGWFDVLRGHAAKEAWDLGYTGEGVKVAVMDTSIDFAHQDLQDSWAVLPDGHPRAGWPQVYDPYANYNYLVDTTTEDSVLTRRANGGMIAMYQVLTTTMSTVDDVAVTTACAQALANLRPTPNTTERRLIDANCSTIVPASKSGTVYYGHHPDGFLARTRADATLVPPLVSQYVGVILYDPNVAGEYDTVVVDLNNDLDFTNDKPVTKDSPLSWGEFGDPDGIADLSGGLMYYIADGETPLPGAYLYESEETPMAVPAANSYVAFHVDGPEGGHGTLCASNVASRGRLGVPPGANLSYRDLPGDLHQPMPINPGMAKGASLVAVGDIYRGQLSFDAAWRYGVLGETQDRDDDDPQITSNSYGFSGTDNDGWDDGSRSIDWYVRTWNPSSIGMYSTGNGAPGYGTIAPPTPRTGMQIAASTQMGSTGWDSAFETSQITFGDVTPWSNRGPGALGSVGPTVATDGAYAAGANPINAITTNAQRPEYARSGEFANVTWGGTSRSSPVAAGLMALVFEAYRDTHGRWPTWYEAQQLAMGSARFNGYDPMTVGAGVMDAGDAVRMATGAHGVYADPPDWTPGGYKGVTYPGFAKLMHASDEETNEITLHNTSSEPVEVELRAMEPRRIDSFEFPFASAVVTDESPYTFNVPDYLIPIEIDDVPEGAELMVVRLIYPMDQADVDANQVIDNNWRMGVYQHTDWNDNQTLWTDKDGDGAVDGVVYGPAAPGQPPTTTVGLEGSAAATDFSKSEIEEGEYMRFSYLTNEANNLAVYVHHPRERWSSGMFIGLWHRTINATRGRTPLIPVSNMEFRVEFFKYEEWPWAELSNDHLTIPAATDGTPGTATFNATISIPDDAPVGAYQGAIFADYERGEGDLPVQAQKANEDLPNGGWELEGQRTVIPSIVNVAAEYDWTGSLTLGGEAADDRDAAYNNGAVQGTQSWTWRPESGDWRFFFIDATRPAAGTTWIARTEWQDNADEETWSDVDTRILGPQGSRYSDADHPGNQDVQDRSDPDWYGPYALAQVGGSTRALAGAGRWPHNTTSGSRSDWVSAPAAEGLHEFMWHNVLLAGTDFELPTETEVGSLRVLPTTVKLYKDKCEIISVVSTLEMKDFALSAYGLTAPTVLEGQSVGQDDPDDQATAGWKHKFTLPTEAPGLTVTLDAEADGEVDLDMYLFYDRDGDGEFGPQEEIASSQSPEADERITRGGFSSAGDYEVHVHGWSVPTGNALFDLRIDAVYGTDLNVSNVPETLVAGQEYRMTVCADPEAVAGRTEGGPGTVFLGPGEAPLMVTLPVTWEPEEPPTPTIYLPTTMSGWSMTP